MTTPAMRLRAPAPSRERGRRSSTVRLVLDQVSYALRDLWRSRIAFIFTFLFPLTFLVVLGAIAGNDTVDTDSSVRVMQFVTPSAAVMGALYGAYPTVASTLAEAREAGVLKRVRGTPLPGWIYLAGRIGAATVMAVGSLALMLVVGALAYDVQVRWHTMLATAVTVLVSITAFAALGVAVAGLARSANVAMAASIASAVALSMVSGVMGFGDMPGWAERTAQVFPLQPFNEALRQQFDPFASGNGWDLAGLAVIAAWAVAGVVVGALTFRWEPGSEAGRRAGAAARQAASDETDVPARGDRGPVTAAWWGDPACWRWEPTRHDGRRWPLCATSRGSSSPSPSRSASTCSPPRSWVTRAPAPTSRPRSSCSPPAR